MITTLANLVAVGLVIGSVIVVGKYRSTIDTINLSGEALRREMEAQRERGDRLEEALHAKEDQWVKFSEEQRELRHQLKNQLAAAEAKTDITVLVKLITDGQAQLMDKLVGREELTKITSEMAAIVSKMSDAPQQSEYDSRSQA